MSTPPIACTLTPGQLHCQAAELLPALAALAEKCQWTDTGMRLTLAPTSEHLHAIIQTIDRERICCAFLTFRLEIAAARGALTLELSGPDGTRAFLEELGLAATPV